MENLSWRERVRQVRDILGWSQDRMAREIDIGQATLWRWENLDLPEPLSHGAIRFKEFERAVLDGHIEP